MANYNRIILMGNLTRDPELKYLPSGTAVTNVGVAVNRTYTDRQSGERREEVCFVDLEAFGRTAENVNEYFQKGRQILVEGRLRYRTWETDDGQRRSKHDVLIDRFEFVGSRQDSGESLRDEGAGYSASDEPPPTEDDIPF
jgi:single-strand DNA-binding protein